MYHHPPSCKLDLSCDLIGGSVQLLLCHDDSEYIHDDRQCDDNNQNIDNRTDVGRFSTVVFDIFTYSMNRDNPPLKSVRENRKTASP